MAGFKKGSQNRQKVHYIGDGAAAGGLGRLSRIVVNDSILFTLLTIAEHTRKGLTGYEKHFHVYGKEQEKGMVCAVTESDYDGALSSDNASKV